MRGRRVGLVLLAVLSVVLLRAEGDPRSSAASRGDAAGALPGEVVVVRLASRWIGDAELRVRGQSVARLFGRGAWTRLRTAAAVLYRPLHTVSVSVEDRGDQARVIVDGRLLLVAGKTDAAREGTTPGSLAGRWTAALQQALNVPPIRVSRSEIVLSPGGIGGISVSTAIPGAIRVEGFDPAVADVQLVRDTLNIAARRLGRTGAILRLGPYRAPVSIAVLRPAGTVPVAADVVVTGSPASPELVREAIDRRLRQIIRRDPGASVDLGQAAVHDPLGPGASLSIPVGVRIRSPYGGPVEGSVMVSVSNAPIRLADPARLLVSNRPETITDSGLLFHEKLTADHPARLLFHHMNGTPGQPRILKITLANPGTARARVHYLSGLAGPSSDPVLVGHLATARFLAALTAGLGYVVEVPPRGTTEFTAYNLPPLALVSGLMQYQVIEGGPVDLTVHVRLPWLLDRTVTTDLGPWAFPHPRGTFPGALVDVTRDLLISQPSAVGDLGIMSDLKDLRTGEPLVGDYGVLYRFRLRLLNPTDRQATVALHATAAGGPARGLFLIDGSVTDVGYLQANEERVVSSFTVSPGSTREVTVLTMPIAGSFYPVRLAIRPQ